jgi:hypothetical protein
MMGLDLAPGDFARSGGGVGKGQDAGVRQGAEDGFENVRVNRRIAVPDG